MSAMTVSHVRESEDSELIPGVRIVDCDAHFTEPPDLWSSRVASVHKDSIPQHRTSDGATAWFLNGERWASVGGNTIRQGMEKVLGTHTIQPFELIDPASWSVRHRLELLDAVGISRQIIYPNGVGFSSNHMFAIEDIPQRTLVLQTYNDFLVDVQDESGGRLLPQAVLPIWDMDLTVREMTRLLDRGIRGFTLSDKPELLGLAELPESYFDPMWDLFNESGAVASFHIGSGARKEETEAIRAAYKSATPAAPSSTSGQALGPAWRTLGSQRRHVALSTQMYMSNVRVVINLCLSNLFDRYPGLKIVSAESGIGWVPFVLEALEYQYDEGVTEAAEVAFAQRRPREYFQDHIYVMWWFEEAAPRKLFEDIGVNNVLVETDIPHPTCLYPNPRAHFARVLKEIDPKIQRRVLEENAAELYKIDFDSSLG